jgi:hypothetical protein
MQIQKVQAEQVMPSKDEFLKLSQVKAVISRNRENNTPVKCIDANEPTLGALSRTYGNEFCENYLCVWLIEVQEMIGVKNKMNDSQIAMCAQMVLEDFKYLNLADIQLVCKRAIKGDYGQFFESVSIPKVIEWFKLYFDERCESAAMRNTQIKQSGQIESNASDVISALLEIGVIDESLINSIGKNSKDKEDEFQKVKADYFKQKTLENGNE